MVPFCFFWPWEFIFICIKVLVNRLKMKLFVHHFHYFFNFLIRFRRSWPRNALLITHRVRWFTFSVGTFKLLQNCPCPFIKEISIRSFLFVEESFQPLFYPFSSLFIPSPFPISLALNKSRKQGRSSLFLWVNFHFKFMHSRVLM
jgi:hypothetical protein